MNQTLARHTAHTHTYIWLTRSVLSHIFFGQFNLESASLTLNLLLLLLLLLQHFQWERAKRATVRTLLPFGSWSNSQIDSSLSSLSPNKQTFSKFQLHLFSILFEPKCVWTTWLRDHFASLINLSCIASQLYTYKYIHLKCNCQLQIPLTLCVHLYLSIYLSISLAEYQSIDRWQVKWKSRMGWSRAKNRELIINALTRRKRNFHWSFFLFFSFSFFHLMRLFPVFFFFFVFSSHLSISQPFGSSFWSTPTPKLCEKCNIDGLASLHSATS